MRYDAYLAAGLPVATGVIESACGSLVKHRTEGNGKRWSVAGAEAILLLGSMKKSYKNDLKDYWAYRAAQERYYLYENRPERRPNQHIKVVGESNRESLHSWGLVRITSEISCEARRGHEVGWRVACSASRVTTGRKGAGLAGAPRSRPAEALRAFYQLSLRVAMVALARPVTGAPAADRQLQSFVRQFGAPNH